MLYMLNAIDYTRAHLSPLPQKYIIHYISATYTPKRSDSFVETGDSHLIINILNKTT